MNNRVVERAFDIRRYLRQKFGREIEEHGSDWAIACPTCQGPGGPAAGKQLKLWVLLEQKHGKPPGTWICYYCDESGRLVDLIQLLEGCTKFRAYEILFSGIEQGAQDFRSLVLDVLEGREDLDPDWTVKTLPQMDLPEEFEPFDARTDHQQAVRYFAERGISVKRALRYQLGFCRSGYWQNRLIVPVHQAGQPVLFLARWMAKRPPARRCGCGHDSFDHRKVKQASPCYLCECKSFQKTKKTLYPRHSHPNKVLFNLERVRTVRRIILVEDVFSAMHLGASAVATFGTTLSQYQLEQLLDTQAREVVLLWDRDATVRWRPDGDPPHTEETCDRNRGKACASCQRYEKTIDLAFRLAEFWRVRVPQLTDARDPDELPRDEIERLIDQTPVVDPAARFRDTVRSRLSSL